MKRKKGRKEKLSHKHNCIAPPTPTKIFAKFLLNAEDSYQWKKTRQHNQVQGDMETAKKQSGYFEKLSGI